MRTPGFALFDTSIGRCAVAWNERGIAGVQLPEARESVTRARMLKRFPGLAEIAAPRPIAAAIKSIQSLLAGKAADLGRIVLDMERVTPFHRRVYEAARTIPAGRTLSYGEIARQIGSPSSARAVGQALGRNPFPIVVPCHRVMAAGGKTGGFTAEGGVATKVRILALEGVDAALKTSGTRKKTARETSTSNGSPGFSLKDAVRGLRAADPVLARVIDAVGPCTLQLKSTQSIFSALAEAVVYQQLTGKAAATIHGRVCALFPRRSNGFAPRDLLGASDAALRGAGLSRAKVAALRDLARKVEDGHLPTLTGVRSMTDDEIVERLTAVRGIGRWTVEMLLIFRLGRPDVLPVDDYGIRKGLAITLRKPDLPSPKDVEQRGRKWKPYRTAASWYLWRATDLATR